MYVTWQTLWRVIQVDDVKMHLSSGVTYAGAAFHPHTDLWQLLRFLYEELKDGQRLWQTERNVLKERDKKVMQQRRYF